MDVCFGRAADEAAQLEVEFSLNNGTLTDGRGNDNEVAEDGQDDDMEVELVVQFADVA